jgi:hypothetical protein
VKSDPVNFSAGDSHVIDWTIPDTHGFPIAFVGIEINGKQGANGTVYLDYITWDGPPNLVLDRPYERKDGRVYRGQEPTMWKRAWVDGFDGRERLTEHDYHAEPYRLIQNKGRGLLIQGTREWADYEITAHMTPHMCKAGGIGVRVQGMQRYYALLCDTSRTRLIKCHEGHDEILAEAPVGWTWGETVQLSLRVAGQKLVGRVNDTLMIEGEDPEYSFPGGGIALMVEEGRVGCDHVAVKPLP